MFSLVYISSAIKPFSNRELTGLLRQAREKNAQRGITGMLLYKDGNFMQLLEGREQDVLDIFGGIQADLRHKGIITLLQEPIAKREFADWAMAFHNLKDPELHSLPGFSEFMNLSLEVGAFAVPATDAKRLLSVFHRMNDR